MGFIRQKFSDSDKKDLKSTYSFYGAWKTLGLLTVICVLGPLMFPLIRPKYGHHVNSDDREFYTMINFIWLPILLLTIFSFIAIRLLVDLIMGYKKIGDFHITKVMTIGPMKILILDRWRLFYLKKSEAYFEKVQVDYKIKITRTGTHRLMDYYVYDKNASA